MKPWIGITMNPHKDDNSQSSITADYYEGVAAAGGVPVLLPALAELEMLARLDGILFTGGPDIDPVHYGELPHPTLVFSPLRDASEILLYREARAKGMPMLGICRGIQLINVAAGGTLWQDIPSQLPNAHGHSPWAPRNYATHGVTLDEQLREMLGETTRVNSFHHQAVKDVAPGFRATGYAADGVIEAIEADEGFVVGIQWHCENLWRQDRAMLHIFEGLVNACRV